MTHYTLEWAKENMNNAALARWGLIDEEGVYGDPMYFKELVVPVDDYINGKWKSMYNMDGTPKNAKGKFHKALVDTYLESQKDLPENERQGLLLPGIYKNAKDRIFEGQNILDVIKGEAVELKDNLFGDNLEEDQEYGATDVYGGVAHDIPIYFRNNLDAKDTSLDLFANVLRYVDMVNTYKARNEVMETGMFLIDKLGKRDVGEQSTFLRNMMSNVGKRLNIKIQHTKERGTSLSQRRIEKFVEMIVFGRSNKEYRLGNFRLDKAVGMLMAHASYSSFGIHVDALSRIFMGASSNFLQQVIQQTIEVVGDPDLSLKTIARGQELFSKYSHDILLKDFGKAGKKTLMGQLIDRYDVVQGEFRDTIGNKVSGSTARKLMSSDALFFHRHLSEYEPQVAFFLGVADSIKVEGPEGEMTLLEAYELDENGDIRLKKGVKWTEADEIRFMNRMHATNKMLNGVYNSFDKSVAEQYIWGRMLMFFRKYLYPSLRRRWSNDWIDYEQDEYQRGYALNFWRAMYREFITNKNSLVNVVKGNGLSTREKQEAAKSLVSFSIWLGMAGIAAILRNIVDADDDDNDIVYNYLLYNALRMQSETGSFWNPQEFMRILRSPTILTTYLERMTKFTTQLFFDPLGTYERDTGMNKKGDSKLYARFVKMLFGQTSYSLNPENAVRTFESLTN